MGKANGLGGRFERSEKRQSQSIISITLNMKKLLFIGILVYAFTTLSFKEKIKRPLPPDTICFIDFDMCATKARYSPLNTALLSESRFLSKFGTPVHSSSEYSKEDKANMKHFIYTGAEAWYMNNHLQTIIFTNSNYKFVMSNGASIKVGDSISIVSDLFPKSWADMNSPKQVFVQLNNSTGPVDMMLLFQFEPTKRLITSISLQ